jgi:ketopantoate reductase
MISVHFDANEGRCELSVKGSVATLCADTITILKHVYKGMREENPESAEVYKKMMIQSIETAFMTNEELDECIKDLINEICNKINKHNEDDLIQELNDLKKAEME